MREFDSVILNMDLPETSLKAGTPGVIVDDQISAGGAYIVEFFDSDGATLDVVVVRADQLTVTLAAQHMLLLHWQQTPALRTA